MQSMAHAIKFRSYGHVYGILALYLFCVGCSMPQPKDLIQAANRGDINEVQRLIDWGVDVNGTDEWGQSALWWAAQSGQTEMVQLLVDNGSDLNAVTKFNTSVLQTAVEQGHTDVVRVLLEHKAPVNMVNVNGQNHLGNAIDNGQNEIVELLLEHGADINKADIVKAMENGQQPIIEQLLEHSNDMVQDGNILDKNALDASQQSQYAEINRLLNKNGTSVRASNDEDHDYLIRAAQDGHSDLADLLQSSRENR